MQVNISFHGTGPGNQVSSAIQEPSPGITTVSDGGGSPEIGSPETNISDVLVSHQVFQEDTYKNIGSPPMWLHESIAAHNALTDSEPGSSMESADAIDTGQGPSE